MENSITLADLYKEYEASLRREAQRLGRDPDQAEDLVQETFMRAMGHLDLMKILKPYQRRAWLRRTLKNLFLDQVRASQRQTALLEQLADERAAIAPSEMPAANPFDLVPERYRELVNKRYVLGMTSQEIGAELGLPAATVRSRLHLALKAMRRHKAKLA